MYRSFWVPLWILTNMLYICNLHQNKDIDHIYYTSHPKIPTNSTWFTSPERKFPLSLLVNATLSLTHIHQSLPLFWWPHHYGCTLVLELFFSAVLFIQYVS
jgi:hypothetical protein